ncbi:MAG: protein translocase subunit SecD [Acidobacteria bacterium]|nr:protein translocase subunit SecD [Acidobacteriota bacterium]
MQKKLRWKIIIILLAMLGCVAYIVSPEGKDAGLFSRVNLGLDLRGGIHLVIQVVTDDALNQELDQVALAISRELKSNDIAFDSSRRGEGYFISVRGVDAAGESEARDFLDDMYGGSYEIQSRAAEGKTDFTLAMRASEIRSMRESTVRQAMQTLRRRVDAFGVAEANLQQYGTSGEDVEDQIIVELPGVDDPDRVKEIIKDTAQLELRLVKKTNGGPFSSIEAAYEANPGAFEEYEILRFSRDARGGGPAEYLVVRKDSVITGKDLKKARPSADGNGAPAVSFFLKAEGAELFERATREHIGDYLAIVLDDEVHSYPQINDTISSEGIITGSFTQQEANDLALLLSTGALPASLKILDERSVGASLGNDSIRSGLMAMCIGFGLVVAGMIVYYRRSGVNAVWCLLGNLIFLLAGMTVLNASLTLPGIAGIILTIGMAVDSNILIFERIREELRGGKTIRAAIDTGFGKVFWTIFDTHITTLIAAAFLFQFGTGPIRGFAVTLTFGLIANMFTAVYFSHRLFDLMLGGRRVEELSI